MAPNHPGDCGAADLYSWLGSPAIVVVDCSHAGHVLRAMLQAALRAELKRAGGGAEPEPEPALGSGSRAAAGSQPEAGTGSAVGPQQLLVLAACGADELLPMSPAYPADVFTACLTTPIKMALRCAAAAPRGARSLGAQWPSSPRVEWHVPAAAAAAVEREDHQGGPVIARCRHVKPSPRPRGGGPFQSQHTSLRRCVHRCVHSHLDHPHTVNTTAHDGLHHLRGCGFGSQVAHRQPDAHPGHHGRRPRRAPGPADRPQGRLKEMMQPCPTPPTA